MPRFGVYQNRNAATKKEYPFLLDAQSPLLEGLETRLVIPLAPRARLGKAWIKELNPLIEVKGAAYAAMTQQMAAIRRSELGPLALNASGQASEIGAAIDFLVHGF